MILWLFQSSPSTSEQLPRDTDKPGGLRKHNYMMRARQYLPTSTAVGGFTGKPLSHPTVRYNASGTRIPLPWSPVGHFKISKCHEFLTISMWRQLPKNRCPLNGDAKHFTGLVEERPLATVMVFMYSVTSSSHHFRIYSHLGRYNLFGNYDI